MVIASLRLELRLTREIGLWRKRRLMRSILKNIHRLHNVSVAEIESHDHPSESVLAVVSVGLTRREVRSTLSRVAKLMATYPKTEITGQTVVEA